jgi:hypothetical protein
MSAIAQPLLNRHQRIELLGGKILVDTHAHTDWGGALTAKMFLPVERSLVWKSLVDFPQWVQYFPDISYSQIVANNSKSGYTYRRLYQVAKKSFFFLSVEVEIYLQVREILGEELAFSLEKGSFKDFNANLKLKDWEKGTLLTYSVAATPTIPVPSMLIQQAMQLDLPQNLKQMRQVICQY